MPLSAFHPLVRSWFEQQVGTPTEAQRLAWPCIARGEHVLVTAPTGSGKTLAAFLWGLDGLVTGRLPRGQVRVLYVSPMRALNHDVRRNLFEPLDGLRDTFARAGSPPPAVQVMTRSGDTPPEERQRMARRPPEILITTPESLNILLTSQRGRAMLTGVHTVILDEIHAVVGTKRGTHLITAVERLTRLAGEVQRIALSATVTPTDRIAQWIGGYVLRGTTDAPCYERRRVTVLRSDANKRYALQVRFPAAHAGPRHDDEPPDAWPHVVQLLRSTLGNNRSTLVFANSKRMVEKVTQMLNAGEREQLAFSHHGALSRELRAVVEQRLKEGQVKAIVATNSLELGIDIGMLDQVVLVQTPPSIASTVQRVGRAGHGVGETSRGLLIPLTARDVLDAAVVCRAVLDRAIEPVRPVQGPLDVLAQLLVSMTAHESWDIDALYAFLRMSDPYHDLSRRQLDLVLEMLAGRYASARVPELRPLVSVDRVRGLVRARPGADRLVYLAGGTIPDRGYFRLRRAESMALIGELDEEFVWERSIGDTFTLGVQSWRIAQITHNDVLVTPASKGTAMAPFWRAESRDRSFELSERIGNLLEHIDTHWQEPSWRPELRTAHQLDEDAAGALESLLTRQRAALANALPHRHQVVVENVVDPLSQGARGMVVLHTLWGGQVNQPLAMALQAAWQERYGHAVEVMHDDDCIVLEAEEPLRAEEVLALVPVDRLEGLLRARLEHTGYFGARFREAAGRALLLPRAGFRHRTPLWLSRLRAKKLLDAVSRREDFPMVLEAWRECLQDGFDLVALRRVLEEVQAGEIALRTVSSSTASPFAAGVTWKQTNRLMYESDTPEHASGSRLSGELLREVAFASHLRPRVPRALIDAFEAKLLRLAPGWAPRTEDELFDWIVERVVIPASEWRALLDAMRRDEVPNVDALRAQLADRVVLVATRTAPDAERVVLAMEAVPRWLAAAGLTSRDIAAHKLDAPDASTKVLAPRAKRHLAGDEGEPLVELVADLLRFHGPVAAESLANLYGLPRAPLQDALEALAESQRVVVDEIADDRAKPEVCDAENLERLLRWMRAARRPGFAPRPVQELPLLLRRQHRFGGEGRGMDGLRQALEALFGLPLPVDLWETEVLPARLQGYYDTWLDTLLAESDLTWFGVDTRKVAFSFAADRELFAEPGAPSPKDAADLETLFPHPAARFRFDDLARQTGEASDTLAKKLWHLAWNGRVTNDGFAAVRTGAETRFRAPTLVAPSGGRRSKRGSRGGWAAARPSTGSWYRLGTVQAPADPIEEDEIQRDRVRLLLDRWGVLFRELLDRELPALQWRRVFRTLRVMELSGEVVSGQFFEGVRGLQFTSPSLLRSLRDGLEDERVAWMCATDPASPCGLGLDGLGELPKRLPIHHLVFRGKQLLLVSERRGRRLDIRVTPGDPVLEEAFGFLGNLLTRRVLAVRSVTVETINGQHATESPFRPVLEAQFHVVPDRKTLRLMRRY